MKKILVLVLVCIIATFSIGCNKDSSIGTGDDIRINDTLYVRSQFPNYNIVLLETNSTYVGDYIQEYDNGYQLPWEVYSLNSEAKVLYSAHAVWTVEGYEFPDEYSNKFSKATYVVSEGILDDYVEDEDPITEFTTEVTLEDLISEQPTALTEPTLYGQIRLYYAEYADMAIELKLAKSGDDYYLDVKEDTAGESVYYMIDEAYVELLSSAVA